MEDCWKNRDNFIPVYGWEDHYFICLKCQSVYTRLKSGGYRRIKEQLRNGYLEVYLDRRINGRRRRKHHTLSRLILMSITKSNPSGSDAHHENGIRTDNRPANLIWLERMRNRGDKWFKAGRGMRKFKTADMFGDGEYLKGIAEKQEDEPF